MKLIGSILKSPRTWGLIGTAAVLYLVVFGVLGRLDMGWIMPDTNQLARSITVAWQNLPFFTTQKDAPAEGKDQYVYYTVPTKQFSAKELAQMGVTNAAEKPVAPK